MTSHRAVASTSHGPRVCTMRAEPRTQSIADTAAAMNTRCSHRRSGEKHLPHAGVRRKRVRRAKHRGPRQRAACGSASHGLLLRQAVPRRICSFPYSNKARM